MKKIINLCLIFCAVSVLMPSCSSEKVSADVPAIILENNGQISFSFEAGEAAIAYSIEKPVEGAVLTVELPETHEWLSVKVTDAQICFAVKEYTGKDGSRSEMITVRYTYGAESVKNYITVIQHSSEYVKVYDTNFGGCIWYGNEYSVDPELTKYYVMLETEDNIVITLDLNAPIDTEDMLPPEGEYTAYEYRLEEGYSISVGQNGESGIRLYYDSDSYDDMVIADLESDVKVSRDGNIFTIRAEIVDYVKKNKYLVRYTGTLEVDNGLVESTLVENIDKRYDAVKDALVASYRNYEVRSTRYWYINVMSKELAVGQPIINLEVITPSNVTTPELLVGTYTEDKDMAVGTFVPGEPDFKGTWYSEISNIADGEAYAEIMTPIIKGSIEFKLNENGSYNITINGIDDNYEVPHNVKVVLENVVLELEKEETQTKR